MQFCCASRRTTDIITTVTAEILSDNHVGPGVHINTVGG
ncbi:hypothetical protein CN172_26060 [Sinorhizobium meliloti]|nr:hypothetical protein CN172_26060 [Sinorhizobium meliloti]